MDGYGPTTYGESFADVYDEWYGSITDAEATARFVAERRGEGVVLELGVGSGRLVPALIDQGCSVVGIDASATMLATCRRRVDGAGLPLVVGDLAALPFASGRVGAALIAFNTLFNVPTADLQRELLTRVGSCLGGDGVLVVEAITGLGLGDGPPSSVGVSRMTTDRLVLSATVVDAGAQTIQGQHVDISNNGGVTMRPWMLRWTTPAQLDDMAEQAGLRLAERFADWEGQPFSSTSDKHVSVYRLC